MQSTTTLADIGNGQKGYKTVIGTVTVDEFVHKTSEQTACNYRLITVPAGTYDVVLDPRRRMVTVKFPGIRTDEHFVNRLFSASSVAEKRGIGQPDTAFWTLYDYTVAKHFATDERWELAEDYRVEMKTTHYSDGRPYKSYRLIAPEGDA